MSYSNNNRTRNALYNESSTVVVHKDRQPPTTTFNVSDYVTGSKNYWLQNHQHTSSTMMCRLPLDKKYARQRDALLDAVESKERRVKFVASQLHGAPVVAWVEILSSSVEPITFMVDDRARRSEQFIFNKEVYETLRLLLQITDGQWEPPSSQEMYEDTIVGVCDLSAPTFTQSIVHRGKDLQAEYLLREQLQYFPFFHTFLHALKGTSSGGQSTIALKGTSSGGQSTIDLSDNVAVQAMIEGTNVVVTRVPKKPLVLPADMQDDVLQQEGVGRRLAAHRILKWFYGTNRKPEGSRDVVIRLYQHRYPIFCIADACAETKLGKIIVHQSEGFQARFDLTDPTPLLKVESFSTFWADMVSHALKGISPPIPIKMRHRDQQYRPYTLHANRCMRNRFLVLIFEEDLQLPSHLEHEKRLVLNSSDNSVQKVNLAFHMLKWYLFLSSNAGHQREALKEVVEETKGCDMFVVCDMHAPTVTDSLKYMSPLWRYRLGDLKFLLSGLHRPAGYSSKSFRLWNLIVRPLYNGRPVAVQRKITCRDGVERWYEISVSFSSQGRRYVVGTFKPIESPVTEEEIEFGCYDFRPHIYATVRNLEWQPSLNSANEDHLKTIKEWMQEKKGKEGEKRIFSIIDKCFSDIYEAYVYRSPHAARRTGTS